MSGVGYKRRFRPRRRSDRSTPESRPSSGNVRFLGVEVRSTSDSRRRWARSAKTGYDPYPTSRTKRFALVRCYCLWQTIPTMTFPDRPHLI